MRDVRPMLIRLVYVLIDIFFIGLSTFLSCYFLQHKLPFHVSFANLFLNYHHPFQIVLVLWMFAVLFFNSNSGLYHTRREMLESIEVWGVMRTTVYSAIVAIVSLYVLKIPGFPRSILVLNSWFIFLFLSLWRILKRLFVNFLVAHGYNNFNVLIVGGGKVGAALAQEIEARPDLGLKVVGFLDDLKEKGTRVAGHPVIGALADFHFVAQSEFVHNVFITIHHDSQVFLRLLEQARALNIAIRVIPQGFEFSNGDFCKYNIGYIPVLEYCDEERVVKQHGKRLFDFLAALAMVVCLSPAFLVLALLIKTDSRGPVFYASTRYGRRGRKFRMYKFRSMVDDAEEHLQKLRENNEVDGPIFKIKNDPRITRLGRWLRKYSLDELPQLFNVLRGHMSLVGPRPLPIEQIEKEDLRQLKRLNVRPGITGLWQIRGRSDISFARLLKWDIWYINNWSFWLDINILLQTFPVVFKGRGAY